MRFHIEWQQFISKNALIIVDSTLSKYTVKSVYNAHPREKPVCMCPYTIEANYVGCDRYIEWSFFQNTIFQNQIVWPC